MGAMDKTFTANTLFFSSFLRAMSLTCLFILVQGSVAEITRVIAALLMVLTVR